MQWFELKNGYYLDPHRRYTSVHKPYNLESSLVRCIDECIRWHYSARAQFKKEKEEKALLGAKCQSLGNLIWWLLCPLSLDKEN